MSTHDNDTGPGRPYRPRIVGTEPGDVVGGYELLREIGRGGMAEVWVARKVNATNGKFVALKMVLPQYVGDERYSHMFRSEADVSAPLSHGNIVQVFDEGEDNGRSFLVMEWVDGVDLAHLINDMAQMRVRDPYLRLRMAAYIIGQVLHGLSYAHKVTSHRGTQLGIVHRDISPQNILVSVSGDVKVTDFGIAHRMSEETSGIHVRGKIRYMSPEQLGGKSHAPTVDLYAVGAMLHELLEGDKFRSDADDQFAVYRQVMEGVIPALTSTDVPPELDAVRVALLQPDASKRPQTADATLLMLKRWSGYSEMKVELSVMCGLSTGIVRPRTGPMIEPGENTIAPRQRPRQGAGAEADAPAAAWGVPPPMPPSMTPTDLGSRAGTDPGTALLDVGELPFSQRPRSEPTAVLDGPGVPAFVNPRDLEPTHSALQSRWGSSSVGMEAAEPTMSHFEPEPPAGSTKALLIIGGFALLAVAAAGGVALALREPAGDASPTVAAKIEPAIEQAKAVEPLPAPQGPRLGELAVAPVPAPAEPAAPEPEPAPAPAPPAADEPAPAPPAADPVAKPAARPKPAAAKPKPAATKPEPGPEVTVRFRLEGGLTEADVKLGSRIIAVRPHYDTRVNAGKYAVKWRPNVSSPWKSGGTAVIGTTGEWKFFIGPKGVRVGQL